MTTQDALIIVKEQMEKSLIPYQCCYDRGGNAIGAITDEKAELLLGLATLIVYLVEKEDV